MERTLPSQAELEARIHAELEQRRKIEGINALLALDYVDCSADGRWVQLQHFVKPGEQNVSNSMHGGLIVSVMDATMGVLCRCFTGDQRTLTLDIHVNFLRQVNIGDTLYAKAEIQHLSQHVIRLKVDAWTNSPAKLSASGDAIFYRADHSKK